VDFIIRAFIAVYNGYLSHIGDFVKTISYRQLGSFKGGYQDLGPSYCLYALHVWWLDMEATNIVFVFIFLIA